MRRREHATDRPFGGRETAKTQPQPAATPFRRRDHATALVVQPKLTVGPAGDRYEQEADRIAARVLRRLRTDAQANTTSEEGGESVRLRAEPGTTPIGIGGGQLDPHTEASIRHPGGGGALPTALRSQMEHAFGADFSAVRVHADRSADGLARSLSAEAFTTGHDIFFRNDQYRPESASGQETLAHELAHVVQQGGATHVRRRWRNDVWTAGRVHLYDFRLRGRGSDGSAYELGKNRVATLPPDTQVEADDTPDVKTKKAKKPEYARVTHGTVEGATRLDSLSFGKAPKKSSTRPSVSKGIGNLTSTASSPLDLRAAGLDKGTALREKQDGWMVDKQDNTKLDAWDEKHGMEVGAGGTGAVSDLIGIAHALKGWKSKTKSEKTGAVIDVGANVTSFGANVTKVVDSSAKTQDATSGGLGNKITVQSDEAGPAKGSFETTQSDLAAKTTTNIADFASLIQSVKDVFFKVKDAYDVWHKASGTASKGEKARAVGDVTVAFLSTVKSAISTARNLQFTLENAWNAGLGTALPGLGLAMSGLQLVFHAYDFVKNFRHYKRMQGKKRETKGQLAQRWGDAGKLEHKEIAKRKRYLEEALTTASGRQRAALEEQLDEVSEYEISRAFERVNIKSVRRQALNISVDLMNIAGDIATLSGVGATAGVGLKATAGLTKLTAKGIRTLKQYGRDKAAKLKAKGKSTGIWGMYNANKSTENKMKQRNDIADRIYDRLMKLADRVADYRRIDDFPPQDQTEHGKLRDYVRAAGLSWKAWIATVKHDPEAGHAQLVKGLATRG